MKYCTSTHIFTQERKEFVLKIHHHMLVDLLTELNLRSPCSSKKHRPYRFSDMPH